MFKRQLKNNEKSESCICNNSYFCDITFSQDELSLGEELNETYMQDGGPLLCSLSNMDILQQILMEFDLHKYVKHDE